MQAVNEDFQNRYLAVSFEASIKNFCTFLLFVQCNFSDKVIYMQPCVIFRFLFNISEIPTVISLPEVLYSVIFLSDQLGFLYMKAVLCNFPHQWDSVVRYFVSKARNKEEEKLPNQRIREALKELIVVNNDEYSFVLDYCVSVKKRIKRYKKPNERICFVTSEVSMLRSSTKSTALRTSNSLRSF